METATTTETRTSGREVADGDAAARAARAWLTRRLGWEHRLAELRDHAARRPGKAGL